MVRKEMGNPRELYLRQRRARVTHLLGRRLASAAGVVVGAAAVAVGATAAAAAAAAVLFNLPRALPQSCVRKQRSGRALYLVTPFPAA